MMSNIHVESDVKSIDAVLNGLENLARDPDAGFDFWRQIVDFLGVLVPAKSIAIFFQVGELAFAIASKGSSEIGLSNLNSPRLPKFGNRGLVEVPKENCVEYWSGLSQVFEFPRLMISFPGKLSGMERDSIQSLIAAIAEIVQIAVRENSLAVVGSISQRSRDFAAKACELQSRTDLQKLLVEDLAAIAGSPRVSLCSVALGKSRVCATNLQVAIDHASETVVAIGAIATERMSKREVLFGKTSIDNSAGKLPYYLCFPWPRGDQKNLEYSIVMEFETESQLGNAMYPVASYLGLIEHVYLERHRFLRLPKWLHRLADISLNPFAIVARSLVWLGILLAIGCAIAFLFIPYPFLIQGRGILETVDRRGVFSVADGLVSRLHVDDRQHVLQGEALADIVSPTMDLQIEEITGLIQALLEKQNSIAVLLSQLSSDIPDFVTTQSKLTSESILTATELEHARAKLEFLRNEQARYKLKAPIEGMVIAPQATKNLLNRPVRRGDKLMEVAAVEGQWQLNVLVEDRDSQHLLRSRSKGSQQVEIIFDNLPDVKFSGEVTKISERLESIPSKGNCMRVHIRVSQEIASQNFMGAQASVYFPCGTMPIWYVWLRPVADYTQKLWSLHR